VRKTSVSILNNTGETLGEEEFVSVIIEGPATSRLLLESEILVERASRVFCLVPNAMLLSFLNGSN
jgi:hypothetical protein